MILQLVMHQENTSTVSIAVIGAGVIGSKHASVIADSKNAKLTSIVDPTIAGKKLAEVHCCMHYPDISTLLKSGHKPAAAIICTPNETHAPIAQELAAAGVHFLIEKPICTSTTEGTALLKYCRERGIQVCTGHHRRLHAQVAAARNFLQSGSAGQLVGICGVWATLKPSAYFQGEGSWRTESTGGVVLINLIHEVDLLNFLVSPITRVFAERAPAKRGHVAEEGVALTLTFQSGAIGTFIALDNTPSPFTMEGGTGENPNFPFTGQNCYRFFCQKGTLSVPDNLVWTPEDLENGWRSKLVERKLEYEGNNVYEKQLDNFVGVVRGLEEPSCSGEAGLMAVSICQAILRSLGSGMPETVETIAI